MKPRKTTRRKSKRFLEQLEPFALAIGTALAILLEILRRM
jgi:hypothetical protein